MNINLRMLPMSLNEWLAEPVNFNQKTITRGEAIGNKSAQIEAYRKYLKVNQFQHHYGQYDSMDSFFLSQMFVIRSHHQKP